MLAQTDQPSRADVAFYQPWMGPLLAAARGTATGGAETHMFLVARGLVQRGRRVRVIVWPTGDPLPEEVDGVEVVQIPRLRRVFPITRVFRVLWVLRALLRGDARVFVQQNAEFDTGLVGLLARVRRRRFVWAAANVVDFDHARIERSRTNRMMFRLGVRLAHQRVVQTEEQGRLCQERFRLPSTLIKNPCEELPRREGVARAFLWAARMAPYKHPELYVELAREVPEATFWMVPVPTNTSERERLAGLEREAKSIPNLEILPARPRRELLDLLSSVVAVVNTADFEGMPNVLLESWARGVPALVLTHDPDGVVEREGLGGFANGSLDRLIELTRASWQSRHDQAAMLERCRAYVTREHSLDSVLDRWEQMLG